MFKEALEYIVNQSAPEVQEINGQIYSDKTLYRVNHNPKAKQIEMNTLSSLVDYIKSKADKLPEKMFVHIASPVSVELFSSLDDDRQREYLVEAHAKVPGFSFNKFIDHETFCINLQSKFQDAFDRAVILKFAGTVEAGSIAEYGDDGVTQKATVKTGIASKGEALVPNPVELVAYRTFVEVPQPVSSFIFRIKQDKYDGIQCALFEADGGAWELCAMNEIRAYLEENLSGIDGITILS